MEFTPYKYNECFEHSYYQIPQELFINPKYKDKLNSDSKILYSFLLDRLTLSQKNHWVDKEGNIYLIFTRDEVCNKLNLSDKTVTKAFKQLAEVNLVVEKRQGLGKPNLIYVGKIEHEEIATNEENIKSGEIQETEKVRFQSRKIYGSRDVENTVLESENLRGINPNIINTNNIKTESINPNSNDEELEIIKSNCRLEEFCENEKIILDDVIEGLFYKENLRVGNVIINHNKIIEKLKLITKDNLIQLLNIAKSTRNVQNMKNYLMICLYNNLGNTHIAVEKKSPCSNTNGVQRNYPSNYWDKFYANFSFEQAVAN